MLSSFSIRHNEIINTKLIQNNIEKFPIYKTAKSRELLSFFVLSCSHSVPWIIEIMM